MAERRGTTTLELALIAPVLIATMVALAELSYAMTVDGLLNHAARVAARSGFTGELAAGFTDRRAQVCDAIRRNTLGVLDQRRLSIESHGYDSFSALASASAATPAPALTSLNCGGTDWDAAATPAALGRSAQVVVYIVRYTQPLLSVFGRTVLGRAELIHEARLAVRNEPYMTTE
ncbi:hypothetical protein AL072_26225 [Azospirillum thiophilum]|uniref:TadE-like domain-containing protein n=2 Tax=Azospirillum thiophilum TaxID=528244 RepID=A0AAC8W3L7_9PROT|nr:hypothetical protein AL072_26225 [Azospirillum thiophilum]